MISHAQMRSWGMVVPFKHIWEGRGWYLSASGCQFPDGALVSCCVDVRLPAWAPSDQLCWWLGSHIMPFYKWSAFLVSGLKSREVLFLFLVFYCMCMDVFCYKWLWATWVLESKPVPLEEQLNCWSIKVPEATAQVYPGISGNRPWSLFSTKPGLFGGDMLPIIWK